MPRYTDWPAEASEVIVGIFEELTKSQSPHDKERRITALIALRLKKAYLRGLNLKFQRRKRAREK
jgi:hypothetical protein